MLKRRFMRSLVAGFVLVAMLCQGTSVLAGTTGILNGLVVDSATNQPISGATVSAVSPTQQATTATDPTGHFFFLSLAPDTYTVSVEYKGYDSVVSTGVNIFADQTRTLNVVANKHLQTIGRITTRASTALVRPGTTTDVYSVSAVQQDKIAGVGGGGNLNSAWSAIATVPGVFVLPNQSGYIGAGPSISIRGGDYDQIGYEIDGVPVNRAFDNYPSGPVSSLGQQELQVYTGVPPANAQANGLSGFINQVIRTGSYPGFANLEVATGAPSFYHKTSFEVGGSSPNRNFSYYLGLGGYNQDFRTGDQFNGASLSNTYGVPLATCDPSYSIQLAPSCYTNGQYNGNTGVLTRSFGVGAPNGSFILGPYNLVSAATVQDRDSVLNLHFGFPHKNGTKDDLQILGMVNYINNKFYGSTNDQGGSAFTTAIGNGGGISLGLPIYVDGYGFNGPTGVLNTPAGFAGGAFQYLFPNVAQHSFQGPIGPDVRDGFVNDQAIYKVQYTHNMGTNAYLRAYGYSYYSDWLNTGSQTTWADFAGCCPSDYELSSHTRGASVSFVDQISPTNLLSIDGSYSTSSTTRDNNTQMISGLYGTNTVNNRTVLGVLVDPTNPTNGLCYANGGGAPTTCAFNGPAQFVTLKQAFRGTAFIATPFGTCGGGPCQYLTAENGLHATYNQVTPIFTSFSATDEFHPSSKLNINLGLRYDSFQYNTADTTGTAARAMWYNAFNLDTCQDANHNLFDKVVNLGIPVTSACPAGFTAINVTNPSGVQKLTSSEWQPRFGFTYTVDNNTVLRGSYGRYAQGPNSAFVQYNTLSQDTPAQLYSTYSFQKFGFTTPDHAIQPSVSDNFDFSFEHQFPGQVSTKITPFYRTTQGQVQQFFLNQATNFVSGLNVGKQTSRGLEFELDKGNFAAQGLSARLTATYTNSYINYTPLSNGSSVITPLNVGIANYNAYTKACGAGGSLVGTASCGTTASGVAAAPCYTTTGVADNACAAGSIANPYWNAPAQGLLAVNGNYPTFDLLTQGIGSAVAGYGAPYTASLVLNERVGKFSVAPIVQFFGGQRYGAPASSEGIAPDQCGSGLGGTIAGDPRYPYGAPGGSPFNVNNCGALNAGQPNPYTRMFDGIGAFVAPNQLQMHLQMTYDVSKNVTFVGNFTNLINSCFGGTKVAWAVSGACGYGVVGGGTAGDVGNMYNPGAVIQPYVNTPYEPFFTGLPFGMYFSAKIRI